MRAVASFRQQTELRCWASQADIEEAKSCSTILRPYCAARHRQKRAALCPCSLCAPSCSLSALLRYPYCSLTAPLCSLMLCLTNYAISYVLYTYSFGYRAAKAMTNEYQQATWMTMPKNGGVNTFILEHDTEAVLPDVEAQFLFISSCDSPSPPAWEVPNVALAL